MHKSFLEVVDDHRETILSNSIVHFNSYTVMISSTWETCHCHGREDPRLTSELVTFGQ